MAEFPALPLWTDAYLGDTRHLSTLEHGAYLLLLITAWRTRDTSLPDDDTLLAKYAGLNTRQWKAVRPVLERFHDIKNGKWTQLRLLDEKHNLESRREKAAENGRVSALKRKGRHSTERIADLFDSDTQSDNGMPTPTTISTTTTIDDVGNPTSSNAKRGTRLPETWQPHRPYPEKITALVAQWPPGREDRELDQFRDFWASRSSGATKLDWDRTWHNRIRDQHDRIIRDNRNGHRTRTDDDQSIRDPLLARYVENGGTLER